jgi:DNA-binding NarL/FixJ family response regulator
MTRVFVADGNREERLAFRLILLDLKMEVVGEAPDWDATLANAPTSHLDMLLIDWNLLPRSIPNTALDALRKVCPAAMIIVLISPLDARQQAAILSGADVFISKGELPERVAERLQSVAAGLHP